MLGGGNCWAWWHTPVILVPGGWRQKTHFKTFVLCEGRGQWRSNISATQVEYVFFSKIIHFAITLSLGKLDFVRFLLLFWFGF